MAEKPTQFTIIVTIAAGLLAIGAFWDFFTEAINEGQDAERKLIIEQHTKDIAGIQLHLACWAHASLEPAEKQLPIYIYCREGKISKDVISK